MVTEVKEKKNLKLGNWQVFLLEKLNQLYARGELCDVSLKFNDNKSIKAHKVVLTACTSFFDHLPSSSSGVVLHMPQTMYAQHVRPIINFMYTGKLEFAPEDQTNIFYAAKHLGMTVLTELLNVQHQPSQGKKSLSRGAFKKYIHKHVPVSKSSVVHNAPNTDSPLATPLPDSPPTALPGKKLPIWKKRTTGQLPDEFYRSVNKKPPLNQVNELPRPTRFEWPEEEILPDISLPPSITILDTFETLSYDSKIIVKPVDEPKPVISEDSIDKMPMTAPVIQHGTKRGRVSEIVQPHAEDDDDYDDGHFETIHDLEEDDEEDQTSTPEVKPTQHTPPKPILKTHEVTTPTPSKKVRFTFSTESENNDHSDTHIYTTPSVVPSPSPAVSAPHVTPQASSTPIATVTTSGANTSVNHAKIINEILKKYPDLVKNNKNIKLKIQSGGSSGSPLPNSVVLDKDGKPQKKVQYVVLKSDFTPAKKEIKIVMGAENTTGPWFCVSCTNEVGPINFDTYFNYRKHLQEVHNQRIDARICEHCGFRASKRNLHLYHLYTKHNIPPPRNINFPKCDQCNYIALSESLLIKHRSNHTGMLSKEYVCRLCNAAFKSNGALMGHMQTNLHHVDQPAKKNYECEYCSKVFNRNINLKAHIRTSHQEENRKMYDDEDKIEDSAEVEPESCMRAVEEPLKRNENVMEVIEVPVFDSVPAGNKTLYLPQGMTILADSPAVPLMPSSESEAMNNVATGIATSINITDRNIPNDVIVIDGNSDIILRGTPATYHLLNQDGSYSVQEYIVPEIMGDSGAQVYTAALVSTAPTTGISYVNSDNISIITSGTDHTYADGMKINGHVNTAAQGSLVSSNGQTVITSQVQVSQPQANQPIIMQEPLIMSADWVQTIASSQAQSLNLGQGQKLEVISVPVTTQLNNRAQTSHQEPVEVETAEKLVSDWGDLEEDNQENDKDKDDESEVKPSRPTIELDIAAEIDM